MMRDITLIEQMELRLAGIARPYELDAKLSKREVEYFERH